MTGILINARLGSTRLINKHLIKVNNRTLMEWLLLRFLNTFKSLVLQKKVKLIIATSVKPENEKFKELTKGIDVEVFYGNDENIPLRQIECAKEYNLQKIISIDGDDILCSTEAALNIYNILLNPNINIAKTTGLPLGMNVIGYRTEFLRKSLKSSESILETGWGRIFNEREIIELVADKRNYDQLRFTLDYELDSKFFSALIERTGDEIISISDPNLIDTVIKNKLYEINNSLITEYWANFNNQKEEETKQNNG